MKLTVKRFGGHIPTLQPRRVFDLATLEPKATAAVHELIAHGNGPPKRIPDAYSYELKLDKDDGSSQTVTVSEFDVPDVLLKHLP
jgi:hypothetical protein